MRRYEVDGESCWGANHLRHHHLRHAPSLAASDCKAVHDAAAYGQRPFLVGLDRCWLPPHTQVLGCWPENDHADRGSVVLDIPLTPAVRALIIPGQGFRQFGGQLPRLSPRSSVQCSFQIETRNAEAKVGEMNRSEEPAIDPGAGLRTRIVGLDDLGAAAFGNIAVRRVPEAELISPLPLTAMAR